MNYRMIKTVLGWLLLFEAGFFIVPIITAAAYREDAIISFLISMAICIAAGLLLLIVAKPKRSTLYAKDGFVIVSMSWIFLSLFGSIPFVLSGAIPSFTDALFETVSGFTTTGASVIPLVEDMPKSILMWRSFTHWVGGMGVLVFIMAFLPLCGGGNMHIMKAESPGPSVSKLVPRVRKTALILYSIYLGLTAIQLIVMLLGGMSLFDALNTAFSTAGTGGFGFRNDGMNSFSPFLQTAIAIFMLLFSLNFTSYYLALKLRFKSAFSSEIKVFLAIVAAAVITITLNIRHMFDGVWEAARHALFAVSSLISTTGFSTVDFDLWPELSRTILVLVMFIGACAGSTGGGMKVSRLMIIFKDMFKGLKRTLHPRQVKKITIDSHPVEHEVIRAANSYLACYVLIFAVSMMVLAFNGHDLVTNFTATTATMNNIGPGLGMVGPTQNYAFFSVPSKLILIFNMLAGRLELFPMLLLFTPATWRK